MKIAVVSCWWNEEAIAKLFLKGHAYADKIFAFVDTGVTDRTREILRTDTRVEVIDISMPNGLDDGYKIDMINAKTASLAGAFDWVVGTDSDEFLHDNIRKALASAGQYNVFNLHLYDIYKHHDDQPLDPDGDLSQRRHGIPPNKYYVKPCIVKPQRDFRWDVGCHGIKAMHGIKISPHPIVGTHWHWAEPSLVVKRTMERKARLSQRNKNKNWGTWCLDSTEENVLAECEKHSDEPLIPEPK